MDVPMLDDEEFKTAHELYNQGFKSTQKYRFKPLLDYYDMLTGFNETEPAAIMHHQVSQYGSLCEICGKPYRTKMASFCAFCGNKK
jgi:hypothetical protein